MSMKAIGKFTAERGTMTTIKCNCPKTEGQMMPYFFSIK